MKIGLNRINTIKTIKPTHFGNSEYVKTVKQPPATISIRYINPMPVLLTLSMWDAKCRQRFENIKLFQKFLIGFNVKNALK